MLPYHAAALLLQDSVILIPWIIFQGSIGIVYESFKCEIKVILGSQRAYETRFRTPLYCLPAVWL